MSEIGPLGTCVSLLQRSKNLIDVYFRNDPNVVAYRLWGASTVNDAYGNPAGSGVGGAGPAAMFTMNKNGMFRSNSIARRRQGMIDESRRGLTSAIFDVEDFTVPGGVIPKDTDSLFVRAQENRLGAGLLNHGGDPANPVLGPIYMIPPASFFGGHGPGITLGGIAPAGTTSTAGRSPVFSENGATPSAMFLMLPSPVASVSIQNLGAAALLVAFGSGQPMVTVPANTVLALQADAGAVREIVLAAAAAAVAFSISGLVTLER